MAGSLPKPIKQSNDPPLSRGYTLGSGEDSLELKEWMANCTQIVCFVRKKNREICLELILLGTTLSTVNVKLILPGKYYYCWMNTIEEGLQAIFATIDGHEKLIIEDSLRRHLKLDDAEGISSLSNEEIFEHLAHMGYATNSESLTFFKEETASMPHDSPLHDVHSYGSAKGSVQQHDLTVLVTTLNDRIDRLEKDLQQTKKTYSTALTKLVLRVKKLEYKLKSGKARRNAKIVLSDDKEITKDSSKQGRKISQIDEDPTIFLEQDEGKMEISTANIQVSTASPPKVSTAVPHVYTRRSAKDKGKAIMEEPATPKKVKKRTQVQLSMVEELARKMEEEERIRFNAEQEARDLQEEEEKRLNLEVARELQRKLDQRHKNRPVSIDQARRNMITYLKNQGGFKESYFKKMRYDDIRPIFEREKVEEEEDVNPEPVLIEKKAVEIRRKTLARRRASDKQVPDEEEFVDPEILHTKFPIVDWESQSLGNMHVYKIIRSDGNTSYHKTFESMLKSFDRHDLAVLHRLVMERIQDNTPKGYNLMLWGGLKILVDPKQDDDIWKNQNQWKIISWKLYETCGVHTLMVDGTLMLFICL
ncbi:hypothetical protein Tco_0519185 [Tanacetum coccineum]